MSLRAKILLVVLAVVSLYAVLDYTVQYFLVLPSFRAIERVEAQNCIRLFTASIKRETSRINKLAQELALSDDTKKIIENRDSKKIENKLNIQSFIDNKFNHIHICNTEGETVYEKTYDLDSHEKINLGQSFSHRSSVPESITGFKQLGHKHNSGIFMSSYGPILVSSRPIINENFIRGKLTIGRFLEEGICEDLLQEKAVKLSIWDAADKSIPTEDKKIIKEIDEEHKLIIHKVNNQSLKVYRLYPSMAGGSALLIRFDIPRDITARSISELIKSNLFSNIATGLCVMLVLFILLQKIVVRPIRRLTKHTIAIGNNENKPDKLAMYRNDEIGTLSREFDQMVDKLAETRKKLFEQSYHIGMTEIASGVLHNVRNALTPMVSRIDSLRQKLSEVPVDKIEMAKEKLSTENPQGQCKSDLIQFIDLATQKLFSLLQLTKEKLKNINEQALQVERMITEHSKLRRLELFNEKVELEEVIRESIELLPDEICNEIKINISPSVQTIGTVKTYRIALLQIFNNILINSAESIGGKTSIPGQINISAEKEHNEYGDIIHVQIRDNGEGIEVSELTQIFERGFSTKQKNPSGIGLHWCANTIAKMNGRIYAESHGKGHGTCMHILFPAHAEEAVTAEKKVEVQI